MNNDWSRLLKDKLESYVPDDVQVPPFEDLRQKMLAAEAGAGAAAPKGASTPLRKWLTPLAVAASLAAVVAGGALLLHKDKTDLGTAASVAEVVTEDSAANGSDQVYIENQPEASTSDAIAEAAKAQDATTATTTRSAKSSAQKPAVASSRNSGGKEPASLANTAESTNTDSPENLLADSQTGSQGNLPADARTESKNDSQPAASSNDATPDGRDIYSGGNPDPFQESVEPVSKQLRRFSIGASGILAASGTGSKSSPKGEGLNIVTDKNGKPILSMGSPELQYHYTAPVSGGLSVRYHLTNQFYAETGLRFTYLHTLVSPTGAHQNLLYAGVPVGVGCKFVQLGHFDLYGSAYGMVSKCISGSESTNFPSNYASLDEIPLMWSAGIAPGAEYHFGQLVSLYAEPTLSYYFKSDEAPQTLYKDNPLYFTVNIGVRFNL